jgi:hypothetical protein
MATWSLKKIPYPRSTAISDVTTYLYYNNGSWRTYDNRQILSDSQLTALNVDKGRYGPDDNMFGAVPVSED